MHYKKLTAVLLAAAMAIQAGMPAAAAETVPEAEEQAITEETAEGEASFEGDTSGEDTEAESTAPVPDEAALENAEEEETEPEDDAGAEAAEEEQEETETIDQEDLSQETEPEEEQEETENAGTSENTESGSEEDVSGEADIEEEEFEEITIELDDMFADVSSMDIPSEEEMLEGYVDSVMFSEDQTPGSRRKLYSVMAGSSLSRMNLSVYRILMQEVALIAEGQRSSTQITFSIDDLGLEKTSWTAEELGVDAIVVNGSIPSTVIKKVQNKVGYDFDLVVGALLEDNPYALYWFNKTGQVRSSGYSLRTIRNDLGQTEIEITGNMTISMPVAAEYALSEYETDTSYGLSIQAAKENASQVVEDAAGMTDYDRLQHYREAICEMTSYNWDAAGGDIEYGNPWQLIWVFDGDSGTKVVCEGYAKAFKYLCDMTDFESGDISCILAIGNMETGGSGGGHMWNVVKMDNGKNYLADITNCDSSAGFPDTLFLTGPEEGDEESSVWDSYTIVSNGGTKISYSYFTDMYSMYAEEDITLAYGKYFPEQEKKEITEKDISINETQFIYTGKDDLVPEVLVELDGFYLREGTDYSLILPEDTINAGTKKLTVKGTGEYTGSVDIEYEITPADISDAEVDQEDRQYTETGKEIRPAVSVSFGGQALEEGTDYILSYKNNILPGSAETVITGKGNFRGEKTVPFSIIEMARQFRIQIRSENGPDAEGAVYGIYGEPECTEEKARVVLDENGAAVSEGHALGNWYVKEITPPFGFEKNMEVYDASFTDLVEDGTRTVAVKETAAAETGLVTNGKITNYILSDGSMVTGFIEIDGRTYYFGADGAMVKGKWVTENGKTYLFGADGRAYEGLRVINGKEFYFDEKGARKLGFVRDEEGNLYFMQAAGALKNGWKTIGISTYYFGTDGKAVSGQALVDGKTYTFGDDCALLEGLVFADGETYYVGSNGKIVKNIFKTVDRYTYFFGMDGKAYKGLRVISGKAFFFDDQGRRKLGLVSDEEGTYYMLASGMSKNEWKTVSGKRYYFDENGRASSGLVKLEDGTYYFGKDCAMVKNRWVTIDRSIYFFGADGRAYTGLRTINDKPFRFTDDGRLTSL